VVVIKNLVRWSPGAQRCGMATLYWVNKNPSCGETVERLQILKAESVFIRPSVVKNTVV
jgi:hypothetical protein